MQSGRQKIGLAGIAILLLAALFWQCWPESWSGLPVRSDSAGCGSKRAGQAGMADRRVTRRTTRDGTLRAELAVNVLPIDATSNDTPVLTNAMQTRCREVAVLAESGTDAGVEQVIEAAKSEPALREIAVRALGRTKSDRAAQYVAAALQDEDPTVQCAAIGAWEAMKGEEAIPDIAKLLEENRERPDGCQVEVAEACVKALGATRSSEALPTLAKELQWVAQHAGALASIQYGNVVIDAVADIGDSRSATMLENHAEALQVKLSGKPMIRQ